MSAVYCKGCKHVVNYVDYLTRTTIIRSECGHPKNTTCEDTPFEQIKNHVECGKVNKNNNCKEYKPTMKKIIKNWFK